MPKPAIHPGEILREEFLSPMGITPYRLAKSIGVPPQRINDIVLEKRAISADTALRLGKFFSTTPDVWMNLQSLYELTIARNTVDLADVKPFQAA